MSENSRPRRVGPIAWLLAGLVRLYQLVVSPWLPPSCRFEPSCSAYALEALRTHGALRGGWLTIRRLGRCHPFCAGGYDPVPEPHERRRRFWERAGRQVSAPGNSACPANAASFNAAQSDPVARPERAAPARRTPEPSTPTVGQSRKSPVASGSPDRGVPAC